MFGENFPVPSFGRMFQSNFRNINNPNLEN
jgi:hypothetical protein